MLVAIYSTKEQGINHLYRIFHRTSGICSGDLEPHPSDKHVPFFQKYNPGENLPWDVENMVFREAEEPCQSNISHRRSKKQRQDYNMQRQWQKHNFV